MKEKIKKIIVDLNLVKLLSIPLYFCRIFPIKDNQILFENFTGKGYGDSPKYIAEELLKSQSKYKIYWVVKKSTKIEFPKGIQHVKLYSLKYFYIMATSKVWVSNSRFDQYVVKRKEQYYIQTWHSPLRLKKIEYDAYESLSDYYKKVMNNDSKNIDLMMSGCDFSYNIYRKSFNYNGEIKKIGTPRCDIFFDNEKCKKIKQKLEKKLKIPPNKKIVIYAPTFRKKDFDDSLFNIEKIYKSINDENVILLLRLHPSSTLKVKLNNKKIIDVSNYPDIQELICLSDIMITDYSSCCFDQLIANKKCILYVPDLDSYLKKERNLYFKFEELPFPIAKNYQELKEIFANINNEEYNNKIVEFKNKINLYENGNATKKVVEIIEGVVKNEKI